MFDINEDEVLATVQKYELVRRRGKRRIYIDLYQVIAGRHSAKFMAVPKTSLGTCEDEYWGRGDSEIDALQECLSRIKDVSYDDLHSLPDSEKHLATGKISRRLSR